MSIERSSRNMLLNYVFSQQELVWMLCMFAFVDAYLSPFLVSIDALRSFFIRMVAVGQQARCWVLTSYGLG